MLNLTARELDLQRLYAIKKTQIELVRDRDYDIAAEESLLKMTDMQFINFIKRAQTSQKKTARALLANVYRSASRSILIYYGDRKSDEEIKTQPKTSIGIIRGYLSALQSHINKEINTGEILEPVRIYIELLRAAPNKNEPTDETLDYVRISLITIDDPNGILINIPEYRLPSTIDNYISLLRRYMISHISTILIVSASLTHKASEAIKLFFLTNRMKNQIFFEDDLTYNLTHHISVPEHEYLSPTEAEAKLIEMKTTRFQLPLLKITNPIARYYGWEVGDIIRIHRYDTEVSILSPNSI